METVKVELPKALTSIEVHPFADLHIGDKHCDVESVKKRIEEVKGKENAYIILNGDIINNATKTSVSDCYAEELTPMEQISRFVELFEPVKDKILCLTSGNHENRTYNKEGIDITRLCARELGVEKRYSKTGALLFLKFGCKTIGNHGDSLKYTIYCNHGSGGGRKEGAKAIRLADMACIVDADIYIHSHTHLPMIMKQGFCRTNMTHSTVTNVTKLFVNTASSLKYGGYGEAFEFKPNSIDTPTIYINGRKREYRAEL